MHLKYFLLKNRIQWAGYLNKIMLAVVKQNRVLSHLQLSQTFYLNLYSCEQCQEGKKLLVEGQPLLIKSTLIYTIPEVLCLGKL